MVIRRRRRRRRLRVYSVDERGMVRIPVVVKGSLGEADYLGLVDTGSTYVILPEREFQQGKARVHNILILEV